MFKIKNIIYFLTILLSLQICYASSPGELCIDLPNNFPKEDPVVGNYSPSYNIHAFFNKWNEAILSTDKSVKIKLLNKKYEGIGYLIKNEFEYEPQISFSNGPDKIDCKLYPGLVNKDTYSKLKSPLLYDPENHICVAVEGWRDYSKINSYFFEPAEFERIVYVAGYGKKLEKTRVKPFNLQEVILLPEDINPKKEKKYIKEIGKLYNSNLNTNINKNNLLDNVGTFLGVILLLPLMILGGM